MFELDPAMAEALRRHVGPRDRDTDPELVDIGFRSVVVRFGSTIVRVARNADAAAGHARETATLGAIDGRLPVAVPVPCRLVLPEPFLPHGAAIQPLLGGSVMTPDDLASYPELAEQIAATLATLHGISPAAFPPGALLDLDPLPSLQRLERAVEPWLRARLGPEQRHDLAALWERCRQVLPGHERVVCHGDAWFGNMLVEDGQLVALLDWEGACLTDPALDLAAQRSLGPGASATVIDAWSDIHDPADALEHRIEGYRFIREISGLAYLIQNDIEEEFEDQIGKIVELLD